MSIVPARPGRALLRGGVALAAAVSTLAALPATADAAVAPTAIVDDSGCTANVTPLNDDNSFGPVQLSTPARIHGGDADQAWVSNNGFIYVQGDSTYAEFRAYAADLDSRATGTPMTYGQATWNGRPALCANWFDIGYYYLGTAERVDVQALVVDRSDLQPGDFDLVYNYGRIEAGANRWANIGYSVSGPSGSVDYVVPGSGDDGGAAFADANLETGMVHGSRGSDVLGRYVYKFRDGVLSDVTDPDTSVTSAPEVRTADADVAFSYESTATGEDHGRFECRLTPADSETATFGTCDDEGASFAELADGTYTFEVRGVDAYGNTDETPAEATFTVDTTGPDTSLDTVPAALSNDNTPTFAWSSDADDLDSFECTLNRTEGGEPSPWYPCDVEEDGTLTDLGDGQWTFQVRGVDDLGNADATPASYDFVVDTAASGVTIVTAPKAVGNDSTPTFTYTANPDTDVDHFECVVVPVGQQYADVTPCDADGFTAEMLADGDYRFGVRVVDHAENYGDPALYDFTVDTVAPGTTITSGPTATNGRTAAFGFAADEAGSSFECRWTAGGKTSAWQACAGSSASFGDLTNGTYTFDVRATDHAGNTDATPASRTVTVSLDKPTITAALASKFAISEFGWYRSEVTITYTCDAKLSSLVGACPAPRLVPRASRGRTIRASIATADGDTASVSTTLYIDKGRPKAEIVGFSGQKTYSSVPKRIRCKASDPRSGLAGCTVKVTKVTKGGDHFIVVRATATDKAGNVRVVTKKAPLRAA